jgi:hypothetical protein
VALANLDTERELAFMNTQANLLINEQNLSYSLESAKVASATQIGLRELDVGLINRQMDTQASMFREQMAANADMLELQSRTMIASAAIGAVGNLKKKNQDEALTSIVSSLTGTPNTYVQRGGGGFGIGDIVGVVSPIAGLLH